MRIQPALACRWQLAAVLFLVAGLDGAAAQAGLISPVYTTTFQDAITGDNAFVAQSGDRYWTIDAGADSYQNDFYERPTAQTYQVRTAIGGGERFAAEEYFANLDIDRAMAGFDDRFLYIGIDLFGLDKRTKNGQNTSEGLKYQYGFRLGFGTADPQSQGGFLLTVDDPENKSNPNAFNGDEARGYRDTDSDVGGAGLSVTKQNRSSEVNGNGYDRQIISDGESKDSDRESDESDRESDESDRESDESDGESDDGSGPVVLFSRINPLDDSLVEFAFDYTAYDLDMLNLSYLEFEAIKGGPKDNQNYLWNDEYTRNEAGSPYRALTGDTTKSEFGTQGLGNIYELDTLRGGPVAPVPEPSTGVLLATGIVSLIIAARGRRPYSKK